MRADVIRRRVRQGKNMSPERRPPMSLIPHGSISPRKSVLYVITLLNRPWPAPWIYAPTSNRPAGMSRARRPPVACPLRHHGHRTRGATPTWWPNASSCSAGWRGARPARRPRSRALPEYPGDSHRGSTPMCGRWRSASRPTPRRCGRHDACYGRRGCGQCGALHRHLARGREAARALGSVPPPLRGMRSPQYRAGRRRVVARRSRLAAATYRHVWLPHVFSSHGGNHYGSAVS